MKTSKHLLSIVIVSGVLAGPGARIAAADNDLCVAYKCTSTGGPPQTFRGIEIHAFEKAGFQGYSHTCTCSVAVHVPTAAEIGQGLSTAIRADIQASIAAGMEKALKEIALENAQREAEMYKRFVEMQERSDAQIKLLTQLLSASGRNAPVSPARPTAPGPVRPTAPGPARPTTPPRPAPAVAP